MKPVANFFHPGLGRELSGEGAAQSGGGPRRLGDKSPTDQSWPCASAGPTRQAQALSGWRVAIVLLALLPALVAPAAAAEEKFRIRIGVEVNSPPLSFVNAQGQPDGFTAELLRAMERTGDLEFEIVPNFWSFVLGEFHAGRLDALANVTINDGRRATMDFSISHASVHAITYSRPGVPPFRHTSQFAGKVMATLSGTIGHTNAVRHGGWGARIVLFNSWADMLQAVKNGDSDFALLMRPLKFEQPDELGLRREFVDDIIHQFHVAVHRGDARTLERINEALATVRHNGTFDRIYAKWIGPIEPHPIRLNDLRPYFLPVALVLLLVALLFGWQRHVNRRLRQQARALHESEEKYRMLVDNAHEAIYVVQDGIFRFVNATMLRLTGLTADQLLGRSVLDLLRPEDHARADRRRELVLSGQAEDSMPREFQVNLPNGRELWVALAGVRITWQGRPATLNFANDITVSRQAEQARREATERLRESLGEKISLLNEVHHRVKNNLQVITSLLRLEAGRSREPATQAVLKDMQGRIRSMALLHETLYRSGNFARINLADYLRQLSAQLFRAQNLAPGAIRLVCELSPVEVEIDQAIPCGLIVNELVTNSLKHAFPGGADGEVRLGLQREKDGRVRLQVSDTGAGLAAGFELSQSNSLGLQLVSDLTKQLLGTLEFGPGATFTVHFTPRPIDAAKPPA